MKPSRPSMKAPPLGLYIHIPWCIKKCPYCDFNSHTADTIPEESYVQALLNDLANEVALLEHRKLDSIFFGGGTPSLFSPRAIEKILEGSSRLLDISGNTEITLEANPGSLEQKNFRDFRSAGVNRLSIGVQSFNDQHLKALGRIHDSAMAQHAIQTAASAGFDSFNIDLMYGLPGQTEKEALSDLELAYKSGAPHLSWYQLTIEQNTPFYCSPPSGLPNEDLLADIMSLGHEQLVKQGYSNYEISAHARAGHQCRHNLNYWQYGDYIGIGAGAHGKSTNTHTRTITRYKKTRVPTHYLSHFASPSGLSPDAKTQGRQTHSVAENELAFEFMMNVLRLDKAFSLSDFEQHTGLPSGPISQKLEELSNLGLMITEQDQFRPSAQGRLILNDVLAAFL